MACDTLRHGGCCLGQGLRSPLGQYFQPTAYRRTLTGVLPSFPTFWNVRRV